MLRELNRDSLLWDVLVDPPASIRIGNKLYFGKDDELVAEVIDNNTTSRGRTLRFLFDGTYEEFKQAITEMGETRCRSTSSATPSPPTRSATRPSTPSTRVPWPPPPPACTSAAS